MDDGARIPPTGLNREKRQRSKRKMASMFFRWLPLLATACGFRMACAIPCEVGSLPSYDSTFCMGHYPHLYFFNNTYIETCPAGYFHRQKHAPTEVRFPHTAHELFFGKRCEQEKVGVIEAWGTQAQNEPGATHKIKSIYATSVGVAGIIDDGLNSVLTWGNHYGDVPTYLRGIKTMYTNFENYAAVTHNGVLYNWGRDARTLNFNLTDVDEVFTNPKSFCVKFKNNTLFVFGDLNRGGCNRCESGNGIACSGSNPSHQSCCGSRRPSRAA